MSSKAIFVILLVVIALTEISSQPIAIGEVRQCYERDCPPRTTSCKKVTRTSQDKKHLETRISCLDAQNMALKDIVEEQPNPFGPHTNYQSTQFSGIYISTSTGNDPVNVNINNNVVGGIEDFS